MRRLLTVVIAVGVFTGVLVACDSTEISPLAFNPFEEEAGLSLYGTLDAGTATQAVRVALLRTSVDRPDSPATATLPVRVFSRRVGAPDSVEWVQEAVEVEPGVFGAVYRTGEVAPAPNATYTLQLLREGGATATATATMPPVPALTVEAARIQPGRVTLPITVTSVAPVVEVEVVYRLATLQFNGNPYTLTYPVPQPTGDRYRIDLDLTHDAQRLREREPLLAPEPSIPTNEVIVRIRVAGEPPPSPSTVANPALTNATGWWIGRVFTPFVLPFDRAAFNPGGFCEHPEDPLCLPCEMNDERPRCDEE
ncbi:MAG: hypothetical protein AAGG50_05195 [Bacteroidota bacterium]